MSHFPCCTDSASRRHARHRSDFGFASIVIQDMVSRPFRFELEAEGRESKKAANALSSLDLPKGRGRMGRGNASCAI